MKTRRLALLGLAALAAGLLVAGTPARAGAAKEALEPLPLELPPPQSRGTRKDIPITPFVEKPSGKPRAPFLAPKGVQNLARGKPVSASHDDILVGDVEMITDGDKGASDGCYVELKDGRQWVQVDLEAPVTIHAIVLWQYHGEGRIYHDVVLQIADDADFIANVRTLYNNDYDNSSGLGIGKDKEYFESNEGRLMPVDGLTARFVRLYSKGNTSDSKNHYTEVEVWGRPAR